MSSPSPNLSADSAVSTITTGRWFEVFRNQSMSDLHMTPDKDNKNYFEKNGSTSTEMFQESYPAVSRLEKGSCEPIFCCICWIILFCMAFVASFIYGIIVVATGRPTG
jgi:hypothetical protein